LGLYQIFVKKLTIKFVKCLFVRLVSLGCFGFIPYFIGSGLTYSVIKEAVKIRMVGIISSLSHEAFGYWIFHALLFEGAGDMIIYLNLLVVYRIM
jgi:hypothetical protein